MLRNSGAPADLMKIMCGMEKTGTMHAWEQEGISGPDIQMIGKALGGGFIPLSGVLPRSKIFDAIAEGSGGVSPRSHIPGMLEHTEAGKHRTNNCKINRLIRSLALRLLRFNGSYETSVC